MCKFFLCTLLCTVFREVWGLKLAATLLSKIKKLFTSAVKNRYKHCLYVYKRHSLHYTFVIDLQFYRHSWYHFTRSKPRQSL